MSFAVVHGSPHASQIALDKILDDVISDGASRASKHEDVSAAELLFYCFRQSQENTFLIDAISGKTYSKGEILKQCVAVARALRTQCENKRVVCVMRNYRQQVALYYGFIFAGVVPLMIEPNSTTLEISHFLQLVEPSLVFCDAARHADVVAAVTAVASHAPVVVANGEAFEQFVADESDDVDSFQVTEAKQDDAILMTPTSGSTGLPKASIWNNRGVIAQLPTMWNFYKFPLSPQRMLLLATGHGPTHSMALLAAPVFNAQVVVVPTALTPEGIVDKIRQYRPTWVLLYPDVANSIAEIAGSDDFASLQVVYVAGAPMGVNSEAKLRSLQPCTGHLCVGIGMTELQGFSAIPSRHDPLGTYGKVLNIIEYKLVDESGATVEAGKSGEMYARGRCVFSGYLGNDAATREAISSDGWLRTGDVFRLDDQGNLVFQERKKFWFKFNNYQIAPEELERVLSGVPGVAAAVVLPAPAGPAALLQTTGESNVTREQVHQVMAESLSQYKQLIGGIAFVPTLPLSAAGKRDRHASQRLLERLLVEGRCR